jgi:hypothetical protein
MFFMPSCENAYFLLDKKGKATFANADQEVVWVLKGAACPEGDESCKPGMQVNEDGTIVIGGKSVSHVTMFKQTDLSPWPFADPPQLRIKKHHKTSPDDLGPEFRNW